MSYHHILRLLAGASASVLLALFALPCMAAESLPDLIVPGLEPSPAPSYQGRLLGDMGGLRRPQETGIDFHLEATNFYHGLLDGDPDFGATDGSSDVTFSGKADLFIDIDGQEAGLWPGLFVNVQGEFRYGDNPRQAGALSPVNTGLLSPRDSGEAFAFTNVTFTQALSETFLVTLGKFNTITLADKNFYGGRGVESFMNINLTAMPIGGRNFPISTLGVVGTVLRNGEPFANFGVVDSISPETSPGWDGLRSDEMTFFADITFQRALGGKPGYHTFAGSFSTIDATSLDQIDVLNQPDPPGPVTPNVANNSWHVNYMWEQFLTQDPADPTRGWGTFFLAALSDGDPNPIEYSFAAGLVANGVSDARPSDKFGIGVFHNGISSDLKDTLKTPAIDVPLQDEYGAEIFYDFAVTQWFRLSADLQIVRPVLEANGTAIFGGLRSRIIF